MAKTFTVSLPDEVYQAVKEKAKSDGVKPSDVIRDGISFALNVDPMLMKSAKRMAAGFGIESSEFISNAAIRFFAENQAHIDVYGGPLPGVARELCSWEADLEGRSLISGDQLYQNLKIRFVRKFEERLERELLQRAKHIGGVERLSQEDQDFLSRMSSRKIKTNLPAGDDVEGGWSGDKPKK